MGKKIFISIVTTVAFISGCVNNANNAGTPPPTPVNLIVMQTTSTSIRLAWSEMTGVSGYEIYRSSTVDGVYQEISGDIDGTTFTDNELMPETTYYYKASSFNSDGIDSDISEPISAITRSDKAYVRLQNLESKTYLFIRFGSITISNFTEGMVSAYYKILPGTYNLELIASDGTATNMTTSPIVISGERKYTIINNSSTVVLQNDPYESQVESNESKINASDSAEQNQDLSYLKDSTKEQL